MRQWVQCNFNQTTKNSIYENVSKNSVYDTAAILSRGKWVNQVIFGSDCRLLYADATIWTSDGLVFVA